MKNSFRKRNLLDFIRGGIILTPPIILRLRTKVGCLMAVALVTAGFVAWPGCAFPPLPSRHAQLSQYPLKVFTSKNINHKTLDEVRAAVGIEDEYYSDYKVACYKLDALRRNRLIMLFGILPVGVMDEEERLKFAMIQFGDDGRAVRIKIAVRPGVYDSYWPDDWSSDGTPLGREMRNAAEKWAKGK